MAHHAPSTSSSNTKSGSGKVIKDFLLGGTSGAIAKTIAAPIERVKLLLQTQENNPKLRENPYKGKSISIQAFLTALIDALKKKELLHFGEATGPMWSDISPLKLSISQPRTSSTPFS